MKKLQYNGDSKILIRIVERINYLLDNSSGDSVSYQQTLQSGTETGEITINGTTTKMYAPTQPTKVSDLQNDSGFITNTVNNLTNYYLKSETYTQAEVNALIAQIVTLSVLVVQTLPTQDIDTHTIYLVPKQTAGTNDVYDEYMYINNAWELIGTTQIDLSNYYTKNETDTLLNAKVAENPTFTEASTRANIASGESFATILGKIKKYFTDLKDLAFIAKDGTSSTKYLRGDGTWQVFPTIPAEQIQSDWNQSDNTKKDYIKNKPTIPDAQIQSDWNQTTTTAKDYIKNKPSLATVATSGSYTDLSDKPTIPDEQIQSDWNQSDNTKKDFIKNKPTIPTNTDHRATFFGTCATAAGTKDKVVTLSDTTGWELRKGVVVGVKYTYTNTYSATASNKITLNVNSTGKIVIYAGNTASPTGTSWVYFGGANRVHYYMYDGTYWVFLSHSADNDSGNYNLRFPDAWIAEKAITAVKCCVGTSAGYKPIASGETFDIAYPVVYSGNDIAVGATTTNFFVYGNNLLLSSVKADFTGTVSSMLYLVGSAFDGKNFTIDSTIATCTPNVSGKYYLPIGTCFSTSRFDLYPVGHVFYYDGTNLKTITGNALTVNGHTVNKDVPSNAVFTDTWTAMVGATSSANGSVGYVNAVPPKDGYNTKYLRADGSWQVPPDTDTKKVFYGTCTGQAANQKKAITISSDQNFTLTTGAIIFVKFDANNTYSATEEAPVQLNVNSSGNKTVYAAGTTVITGTSTTYFGRINYINQYMYDGTYWVWTGSSTDNNNTYTPQGLGIGYGTCTTAAATAAKAATLSGYGLVTNGTVAIKFTNAVPANATLAINGKTAKAIYYRGAAITAGIINAGDTATFFYNGSQYHLIAVDNVEKPTFTEASTRENIASGETLTTILGKIKKWFTDLPSMFVSKSGDFINGVLVIDAQNGTTSSVGKSQINLGNSIPEGTDKNSYGRLVLYGTGTNYTFLQATNSTADRTIELPDKTGTIALTRDILKEYEETVTTNQYGETSISVNTQNLFSIVVVSPGKCFAVPVNSSGQRIAVLAYSNTSATADTLIHVVSQDVTVRYLYRN